MSSGNNLSYHDILYKAVGEARWRQREQEKEAAELEYRQGLVDLALEELKQEQQELLAMNQPTTSPPQQPQPQVIEYSKEALADHEAQSQQYLREKRQNQRLQQEKQFEMNRQLAEAAQVLHDEEVAAAQVKLSNRVNQSQQENPLDNAQTIFEGET
jgi:hypothetical protein